ncbi:hypothetical protein [uncultured Algoriphagus sp.]|uniref:hypothetical protein n=1 Tax=uncultured Algoriphagus sp. TaxID=417365 RepID=UPI0030EF1664|tara:strand:+ start:75848 stop:76105 length:258 start_codon:yes stop_codon:yes gene_type:complete
MRNYKSMLFKNLSSNTRIGFENGASSKEKPLPILNWLQQKLFWLNPVHLDEANLLYNVQGFNKTNMQQIPQYKPEEKNLFKSSKY